MAQALQVPRVTRCKASYGIQRGYLDEVSVSTQQKDTTYRNRKKQVKHSGLAIPEGSGLVQDEGDQCIFEGFGRKYPQGREILTMNMELMRAKLESLGRAERKDM